MLTWKTPVTQQLLVSDMPKLIITSERVQLHGCIDPVPATIEVSDIGKISSIIFKKSNQSDYPETLVKFMDLGNLVILPGLVESVYQPFPIVISSAN